MTLFATKAIATKATRNDSGRAAPALGAAAGAFRTTAMTGAISAAEIATQLGSERMPFWSRCPSAGADGVAVAIYDEPPT